MLILEDGTGPDLRARNGQDWRLVSDRVMGGVSDGNLQRCTVDGRVALHLTGQVSLANNGGFVQMTLDLAQRGDALDLSGQTGLLLDLRASGTDYKIHLRSPVLARPWQSWRADLPDCPEWTRLYVPFSAFYPHRTETPLALDRLSRIGVVAIGREMRVDLALARLEATRSA